MSNKEEIVLYWFFKDFFADEKPLPRPNTGPRGKRCRIYKDNQAGLHPCFIKTQCGCLKKKCAQSVLRLFHPTKVAIGYYLYSDSHMQQADKATSLHQRLQELQVL